MQVLPLLTPNCYNPKKRTRSSTDDFESHCFKKRLISTQTDNSISPKTDPFLEQTVIPQFIKLSNQHQFSPTSGPLVLYQKNTSPRITELIKDDDDSDSTLESDEEPMDLD